MYSMLLPRIFLGAMLLLPMSSRSEELTPSAYVGTWALVMPNQNPGVLHLRLANGTLRGELKTVGSPKALLDLKVQDGLLHFVRKCRLGAPEFAGGPTTGPLVSCPHEAQVNGEVLTITKRMPTGEDSQTLTLFQGKRMPPIPPRPDLAQLNFGKPVSLFNGRNLDGWRLTNPAQINGWKAVDGMLVNETPKRSFDPFSHYGNLRTDAVFEDFRLTLDFNVPTGGNSGVYLRGVYEAQVVDRDSRMQGLQGVGSIFSRIAPSENAGKPGGEWQRYDITLVDRHATVILNGKTVIDNQPLLGATNGGVSADETLPGPLFLQGDHTAVKYRNILLRPLIRNQ